MADEVIVLLEGHLVLIGEADQALTMVVLIADQVLIMVVADQALIMVVLVVLSMIRTMDPPHMGGLRALDMTDIAGNMVILVSSITIHCLITSAKLLHASLDMVLYFFLQPLSSAKIKELRGCVLGLHLML